MLSRETIAAYKASASKRSSNVMEYKGYLGKFEYDDIEDIFHGEVINLRDVITFEGESVRELRQALKDSVEDYLEFCAERGEKPEKPFSGKFQLRLDPELHRYLSEQAARENTSINKIVNDVLESVFDCVVA